MELKEEYKLLFNSITKTIDDLELILITANTCLVALRKAQAEAEEIILSECDNDGETDN